MNAEPRLDDGQWHLLVVVSEGVQRTTYLDGRLCCSQPLRVVPSKAASDDQEARP
jgi:hypothetical protein